MLPFLSQDALNQLANRCDLDSNEDLLEEMLSFLSKDALNQVANRCDPDSHEDLLQEMLPFLSQDTLEAMARWAGGPVLRQDQVMALFSRIAGGRKHD